MFLQGYALKVRFLDDPLSPELPTPHIHNDTGSECFVIEKPIEDCLIDLTFTRQDIVINEIFLWNGNELPT